MILLDGYYHWRKGEDTALSHYFKTSEFTCRCTFPDCVNQRVSVDLINKLDAARSLLQLPLIVTSGFRCHKKQVTLATQGYETAKGVSQHELGNAADLQCPDRQKLVTVLSILFRALGIAKGFCHVDTRVDKERRWTYYHS